MADAHKNFAYSTVATAPSPPDTGTSLVVTGGQGTVFPTPPFNVSIWPAGVQPLTTNAEIVTVTNISTDTLTITRLQESTSVRSILVGDQIAATVTAKTLTDIESYQQVSSSIAGVDTLTIVAGRQYITVGDLTILGAIVNAGGIGIL